MTDPNQELAKKTIDRLVNEGLLSKKEGDKLLRRLAAGQLSQDDWKVAFENSSEKEHES